MGWAGVLTAQPSACACAQDARSKPAMDDVRFPFAAEAVRSPSAAADARFTPATDAVRSSPAMGVARCASAAEAACSASAMRSRASALRLAAYPSSASCSSIWCADRDNDV